MTRFTRRQFIGVAGACGASMLLATGRTLAENVPATTLRERKDIAKLTENDPDIKAYKKAILKMRALTDARSWQHQAEIHGTLTRFGSCRHESWFFLPWHRAYLYAFEEIVRELSGEESFALPYWDWSTLPSVPKLFWGDNNPLTHPRGVTPNSVIAKAAFDRNVSPSIVSGILSNPDFESFAGVQIPDLGTPGSGQGSLEFTPHNFIHVWVQGDMGTGFSPNDPIFWLHHCNVDRLWTEWVRKHPNETPNDPGWLNATFAGKYRFYDRQGAPLETLTVAQTLNTEKLGYRYDKRDGPSVATPMALSAGLTTTVSGVGKSVADASLFSVTLPPASVKSIQELVDSGVKQVVRLRLSDIKPPEDKSVFIDVFVNCLLESNKTDVTTPGYVGTINFFTHGDHDHEHEHGGTSFLLNVTRTFAALYGDRPFPANEPLQVLLVARRLDANGQTETVSTEKLNLKQVAVEIVKK